VALQPAAVLRGLQQPGHQPHLRAHLEQQGKPDGHNHPTPGTDTDSFTRILNIKLNGANPSAYATADIYVTPREIVASGTDMWPTAAHAASNPWYVDSTVSPAVWQGQSNVPVMKLTLDNQANTGAGDYVHMSRAKLPSAPSASCSPGAAPATATSIW